NEVYGLTKGQYSPTSRVGMVAKSTPQGSIDYPLNPVSLALGAEATFVARTIDTDRDHFTSILKAAHQHQGAAFIEIYQNCVVFNDDAFITITNRQDGAEHQIRLEHAQPITFGADDERCVAWRSDGPGVELSTVAEAGDRIVVHDARAEDPSLGFALSRLSHNPTGPTPIGIFRAVERPLYETQLQQQVDAAKQRHGDANLTTLLEGGAVWDVA
ncbi:MAG TPA: thiamine pyrophosphate-dependent enzyme, partial [Nitriliruptorales bacterium]